MNRRDFITLASLAPLAATVALPRSAAAQTVLEDLADWRVLKIGAGGFIVGLDIVADGTFVIRTDTYNAYIWEADGETWRPLITVDTVPEEDRNADAPVAYQPFDLVIAPSETNRLYLTTDGYVYRSDDRGVNWRRTAAEQIADQTSAFHNAKVTGRRLAVDPQDADVVVSGCLLGPLRMTSDGGATWRTIDDVPSAFSRNEEAMSTLVVFDQLGEPGKRSTILYACPWGQGVHRSLDGGQTWRKMEGAPVSLRHAAPASDGTLYVVAEDPQTAKTSIHRFDGNWREILPPAETWENWHSVAVAPDNPRRIVVAKEEGSLRESLDGGQSWSAIIQRQHIRREASDIPWLGWTDEEWMSNGDIRFDPRDPNRLICCQGIGVWWTHFPARQREVVWQSQSRGIEQLVSNQALHPPGSTQAPLLACWDRAIWRVTDPETYPDRHYPGREFNHCWAMDYAATDVNFIAATISSQQATNIERSSLSRDGGQTWEPFASYPAWRDGQAAKGAIAVSSPNSIVWAPFEARGMPHFTRDGGKSWQACNLPDIPVEEAGGFGFAEYLRRRCIAADRVTPDKYYLLHHPRGLFTSEDGGETWTHIHDLAGWNEPFHSRLKAAPDRAGYLFHTAGHSSAALHGVFIRSRDGGRNWEEIPDLLEVHDFAFGKAAPGSNHPTIYVAGYYHRIWGIYRSTDDAKSWTRIGDGLPSGSLDRIAALEGDENEFGRVYVGFSGSGWAYGSVRTA